jgi:hypothetical protein
MSDTSNASEASGPVADLKTVAQIASKEPKSAFLTFYEVTDDDLGTRCDEFQCAAARAAGAIVRHPPEAPATRAAVDVLQFLLRHGTSRGRISAAETTESLAADLGRDEIGCLYPLVDTLGRTIHEYHDGRLTMPAGAALAGILGMSTGPLAADAVVELLCAVLPHDDAAEVAHRAETGIEGEQNPQVSAGGWLYEPE